MHEGVKCFLYWINKYTPLYPSCADMPAETYLVYEYCLSTDRVKDSTPDLMALHAAAEQSFQRIGFFDMVTGEHPHSRMLSGV